MSDNPTVRRFIVASLVLLLAGCGNSKKSEPLLIVGLELYDFEADLAPASIGTDKLPRPVATRSELARRAPTARLVHCAPQICFAGSGWYAFDRGPEIAGRDVVPSSLRAEIDQNNERIVVMQFTPRGQRTFLRVTNAEAHRGRRRAKDGTDPTEAVQHFAIVVRGNVVSLPYIDFGKFPNGVTAENGVQISGLESNAAADRLVRGLRRP